MPMRLLAQLTVRSVEGANVFFEQRDLALSPIAVDRDPPRFHLRVTNPAAFKPGDNYLLELRRDR